MLRGTCSTTSLVRVFTSCGMIVQLFIHDTCYLRRKMHDRKLQVCLSGRRIRSVYVNVANSEVYTALYEIFFAHTIILSAVITLLYKPGFGLVTNPRG
jgi:hypothetical protein